MTFTDQQLKRMKPKEQWVTEYEAQRYLPRNQRTLIHSNGSYIEAVQLDAFKAGAEWAAQFCFESARVNLSQEVHNIGNVILGESSNLKELPK